MKKKYNATSGQQSLCKGFLLLVLISFYSFLKVYAQESNIHYIPPFFCEKTVDDQAHDYYGKTWKDNRGRTHHEHSVSITADVNEHFAILSTNSASPMTVKMGYYRNGVLVPLKTYTISKSHPERIKLADYKKGADKVQETPIFGDNRKEDFNISDGSGGHHSSKEFKNKDLLLITEKNLTGHVISGGSLVFEAADPMKTFFVNITHLSSPQAGIMASKGEFAAGTNFYTGHIVSGSDNIDGRRNDFISIMALEDGTQVTMENLNGFDFYNPKTKKYDLLHSLHGTPIIMNKGDSYVLGYHFADAVDKTRFPYGVKDVNKANGTHIFTNGKKIVVNSGSWCAGGPRRDQVSSRYGHDIGIDQLVPTNYVGQRYIVARGPGEKAFPAIEQVMVVATKDGSTLEVNGDAYEGARNAGQYWIVKNEKYKGTGVDKYMYIESSDPVYVYQTLAGSNESGHGQNTPGMFLVPRLNCNGAHEVNISYANTLGSPQVRVVARTNKVKYQVNGGAEQNAQNPVKVAETAEVVNGGQGQSADSISWYVFKITPGSKAESIRVWAPDKVSPVNVALTISNKDIGAGGFYSGFGTVPESLTAPDVDLMGVSAHAPKIQINHPSPMYRYEWYKNDSLVSSGMDQSSFQITEPADYRVVALTACGSRTYPSKVISILPNVKLSRDQIHVKEGTDTTFELDLKRVQAYGRDITFDYKLEYGTASDKDISLLTTGHAEISPQDDHFRFNFQINDDRIDEREEVAHLHIFNVKNALTGKRGNELIIPIIIEDNDNPPEVKVVVKKNTVKEGVDSNMNFDISLTDARGKVVSSDRAIKINYVILPTQGAHPATLNDDYDCPAGVRGALTYAPGETAKQLTVAIHDDQIAEFEEGFQLVLSHPINASLKNPNGAGLTNKLVQTVKIEDNDVASIALSAKPVVEGEEVHFKGQVLVNGQPGISDQEISFQCYVKNGTAKMVAHRPASPNGDQDFIATPIESTVKIPPHHTNFDFASYPTLVDQTPEPAETFQLIAENYKNADASLSTQTFDAIINDKGAKGDFYVQPVTVMEGQKMVFKVMLTKALGGAMTVHYNLDASQSDGRAQAGNGALTFHKNEVEKTIAINTIDDNKVNAAGSVKLVLTTNSQLMAPAHTDFTGTILDNDETPDAKDDLFSFLETDGGNVYHGNVGDNDLGKSAHPIFSVDATDLQGIQAHGDFNFNTDGSFTFKPFKDYYGNTKLHYTLKTNVGTASAVATIEITDVNDFPVASNEGFTIDEGQRVTKNFKVSGLGDGGIVYKIEKQPKYGKVVITDPKTGEYQFTAAQDVHKQDQFTYSVTDQNGDHAEATITFDVNYVNNHAPVAVDDQQTVESHLATFIKVFQNDKDGDGSDVLKSEIVQFPEKPQHGVVICDASTNYKVEYMSFAGYVGPDKFTYKFMDKKDGKGNQLWSNEATVHLMVEDNTPPVLVTRDTTVYMGTDGKALIDSNLLVKSVTDNSGSPILPKVNPSVLTTVGVTQVQVTATDHANNSVTQSALVLVKDSIPPSLALKGQTHELTANNQFVLSPSLLHQLIVSATDNSGLVDVTILPAGAPSGTAFTIKGLSPQSSGIDIGTGITLTGKGDHELIVSVIDGSNNKIEKRVTITLTDKTPPVVVINPLTVPLDKNGQVTLIPSQISGLGLGTKDNSGATPTFTVDKSHFTHTGTYQVTLTATDGSGNKITKQVPVTVVDTTKPEAKAKDIKVYLDKDGKVSITPQQVDNGSKDNSGIAPILTLDKTDFTAQNLGVNPVVLTATDSSSNSNSVTAHVTVLDSIAPVMVVNPLTVPLDKNGQVTLSLSQISGLGLGTKDNSGSTPTFTVDKSHFTHTGTYQITLTATDGSGNKITQQVPVTVVDTTKPEAKAKDIKVYLDKDGKVSITPQQVDNGSKDNSGITPILTLDKKDFTAQNLGNNSVVLTATDSSSNFMTASATVQVLDSIAPVMVVNPLTVSLDKNGTVTLTPSQISGLGLGTKDNSGATPTFTVDKSHFTHTGTYQVTLTATDGSGNKITKQVPVTVVDTTKPEAKAKDIKVYLDKDGKVSITPHQVDNGSTDNSGIAPILTLDKTDFTAHNLGVNPVVLTATDSSNNVMTASAHVTVLDSIAPVMVVNPLTVPLDKNGQVTLTPSQISGLGLGTTDNSGATPTFTVDKSHFTHTGTYQITLTATDGSGNKITNQVPVTVVDTTKPEAKAKDIKVYLDKDGKVSITPQQVDNGTTDNSGIAPILTLDKTDFTAQNLGVNPVVLTATDSSNNVMTASAQVTVLDSIAPVMVVNSLTVPLDKNGQVTLTPSQISGLGLGTTDNSGATPTFTVDKSHFTHTGTYQVTLTATDGSGNKITKQVPVTVVDTTKPMAKAKDIKVYLDKDGKVSITPQQVDNGSKDNSGIAPILILDKTHFTAQNLGNNPVVLTATDSSSNFMTASATVQVLDSIAPVMVVNPLTVPLDKNGQVTLSPSQISGLGLGTKDNSGATPTFTVDKSHFTHTGTYHVTLTATDGSGNKITNQVPVTVVDTTKPEAKAKDIQVYLDKDGKVSITPQQVDNGSKDNSGITPILTLDKKDFTAQNLGVNPIVLTATDSSSNSNSVTAHVTVLDSIAPVMVVNPLTVPLDKNGQVTLTPSQISGLGLGTKDNSGATPTFTVDKSHFTHTGTYQVTLTATDGSGNKITQQVPVTVVDTTKPEAKVKDIKVYLDKVGKVSITPQQVDNGSKDNSGIAPILTLDKTHFTAQNLGVNPVVLTATDSSSNSNSVTAHVTVLDSIAPIIHATDVKISLGKDGKAHLSPLQIDRGSTDNTGYPPILSVNKDTFTQVGRHKVTFTVTDQQGNKSSKSIAVEVIDPLAPVVRTKDITVALDKNGQASITPAQVDAGTVDNNGQTPTLGLDQTQFNVVDLGPNVVVLTAIDASANISKSSAKVTVIDTLAPTAIARDILLVLDKNGQASLTPAMVDGGSHDNCVVKNLQIDQQKFTSKDVHAHTHQLTVTDQSGNKASAQFTVTVIDPKAVLRITDFPEQIMNAQHLVQLPDLRGTVQVISKDIPKGIHLVQVAPKGSMVKENHGTVTVKFKLVDNTTGQVYGMVEGRYPVRFSAQASQQELQLPNMITPNNDGVNDTFKIPHLNEIEQVSLEIYDRFGKLVYENAHYHNEWGGTERGPGHRSETFYYKMTIAHHKPQSGFVHVVK